ncbi:MAG TPA: hypothetical protein VE961_15975 [Pyrinomonadaceae bacterium]|nr:hypothetical protein [Pyrinomonadaceae bacterium]
MSAAAAAAQTAPQWPDVVVLESSWRIEKYNPAVDKDPFSANREQQATEQAQKANAEASDNRVRQGENALPPVTRQSSGQSGSTKVRLSYIYEMRVRNTGPKEIRLLIWECVFLEPGTTNEVGRRRFVSRVRIKPGATSRLLISSSKSPTVTFDVAKAGLKPSDQYTQQVLIQNIGYADGTNWPPSKVR